jgi:multidrug resistance efflux pump
VDEAKAAVQKVSTEIRFRTTCAPRDATVLRCNLHEGEFISTGTPLPEQAPIVLGDLSRWNVRVDIDEFDASRFHPGAPGTAFFKGQATPALKLEFVSVEPFVIPKRALTNSQQELVDARVLQVIYRVAEPNVALYIGQQLDVFVEAENGL